MHPLIKLAVIGIPLTWLSAAPSDAQVIKSDEIQQKLNQQNTRGLQLQKAPPAELGAETSDTSQGSSSQQQVAVEKAPSDQVERVVAEQGHVDVDPDAEINLTVAFAFDSAVLLPAAREQLDELCRAMKSVDIEKFNIYGHTDATGSVEYNLTLSQARANEVKRYLTNECGLAESRIEAIGMGETKLYDPQRPNAPRNRRVEVQVGA